MNENTLSANLERIKDAVDDIRTAVNKPTEVIEEVANAVEVLADNEYNAYKVNTITEMGAISPDKLKFGDVCTVMDENYSYIPYYTNVLTRVLTFPESFSTSVEPEEFTDVDFSVYSNGSALTAGGNVSLTKGGGSGSGSGSGSSDPELHFTLTFNSTEPTRPCEPFDITITYLFNETENKGVRDEFVCGPSPAVTIIHNTIIFPIECGFKKVGGGNLPSIITDCVKLPSHQVDPKSSITSETLSRACVYDGLFLPFEITPTSTPTNNARGINTYNDVAVLNVSSTGDGGFMLRSSTSDKGNITIKYIDSGSSTYKILSEIKIQDANTGSYVYNYTNYNTTYPNYDFYVYFPEKNEYYLHGQVGWMGELFQQVTMEMPRTYEYQSVEPSSAEPDTTAWVRQK